LHPLYKPSDGGHGDFLIGGLMLDTPQ
jgi:hypothetical protein